MNKLKITILSEIFLFLILPILLYFCIRSFQSCEMLLKEAAFVEKGSSFYITCMKYFYRDLALGIATIVSVFFDIAVIIMTALKDIKVFQPLIDKHNARKEQIGAVRAAKADADKQKRIEELQAELQELKKDE